MKSVLASLKPYYYYLVGEGIKKIEVRKSQPKADDWNKETYFYMSKDEKSFAMIPKEFQEKYRKHFGKVGLRFVCDNIYPIKNQYSGFVVANATQGETNEIARQSCLDYDDMIGYFGDKDGYGWHISDLVVYDEPRELSEFWAYNAELNKLFNEGEDYCAWGGCETESGCTNDCDTENILHCYQCWEDWSGWCHRLTRPPQSWCYVEEKE